MEYAGQGVLLDEGVDVRRDLASLRVLPGRVCAVVCSVYRFVFAFSLSVVLFWLQRGRVHPVRLRQLL